VTPVPDPAVPGDDEVPYPSPHPGAGGVNALRSVVIDRTERPAQRGRGCHLAEQVTLVAQHIDTTHGVPTHRHHHRSAGQHPTRSWPGLKSGRCSARDVQV